MSTFATLLAPVLLATAAASSVIAQAAPPATDIFLAPVRMEGTRLVVGTPVNVTNRPGYDNQPSFLPDGQSLFYQETLYLLPLRPRLVCYQLHAEDLGSELFGFFGCLCQFHAPTLAPSASVDLCFHDDALRPVRE